MAVGPADPPEAFVAWLWEHRQLGRHLRTTDGRSLEVVYPGRRVGQWGPDFRGALLILDGAVARGDVEVHVRSRDWALHRHQHDPAYASTVLHVVFVDRGVAAALGQPGRPLPTVALRPQLAEPLDSALGRWRAGRSILPSLDPCLSPAEAGDVLERAGIARFRAKVDRFEADATWVEPAQALWTGVLEALGYALNTRAFRTLAERVPLAEARWLARAGEAPLLHAHLFAESGLLPSRRGRGAPDEYTRQTEAMAPGQRRGPPLAWRLVGSRPNNSPARRVAAAAALVASRGELFDEAALVALHELPPGRAATALRRLVERDGDPYWREHADFGRPLPRRSAVIGPQRAADCVVNALLPWAAAVGRARSSTGIERAAEEAYLAHPPLAENQVTRHMALQILGSGGPGRVATACRQQGLIAIYHGWCAARDCAACVAGGQRRGMRHEA